MAKVAPNPSKGVFEISNLEGQSFITVFNTAGVQIYSEQTDVISKNIDLSFLNNGVYLLKINTLNEIFIRKLLINK